MSDEAQPRKTNKGRKYRPPERRHFTNKNVASLPAKSKQYRVWDQGTGASKGLHILVSPGGAKTWRSLFQFPGSNKSYSRKIGIVGEGGMSVEEARAQCRADKALAAKGEDPNSGRGEAIATYKAAVEDYIAREQIAKLERATADEARRLLLKEGALWHHRPLSTIRPQEIEDVLERIRDGDGNKLPRKPYLANQFHGRLRPFFAWAVRKKMLAISPMVGIERPWDGARPRDRVFSDNELKALWHAGDAGKLGAIEGAFLKIALLTGKRAGHLRAMKWSELEQKADGLFWNAPPGAKFKRNHSVPLSKLAARVLKGLKKDDQDLVFPGRYSGTLFSAGSKFQKAVMEASGVERFFIHAARHTVETRLAELRVPPHIRDLLLDHAPKRGAGSDYDHWHYGPEMREAAEAWATHLEGVVTKGGIALLR